MYIYTILLQCNIIIICILISRFDSYMILDWIYQQQLRPEVIMRGSKILSLTLGSVRIIDSLSYLRMSLRVSTIINLII
jgi:hypothetical protein